MKKFWSKHTAVQRPPSTSSHAAYDLIPMGAKIQVAEDSMPDFELAIRQRQEQLEKISHSMLDYMLKKLANGESIMYPNDLAGWTLENIDMLRSVIPIFPEAVTFFDREFSRLWWMLKSLT